MASTQLYHRGQIDPAGLGCECYVESTISLARRVGEPSKIAKRYADEELPACYKGGLHHPQCATFERDWASPCWYLPDDPNTWLAYLDGKKGTILTNLSYIHIYQNLDD